MPQTFPLCPHLAARGRGELQGWEEVKMENHTWKDGTCAPHTSLPSGQEALSSGKGGSVGGFWHARGSLARLGGTAQREGPPRQLCCLRVSLSQWGWSGRDWGGGGVQEARRPGPAATPLRACGLSCSRCCIITRSQDGACEGAGGQGVTKRLHSDRGAGCTDLSRRQIPTRTPHNRLPHCTLTLK